MEQVLPGAPSSATDPATELGIASEPDPPVITAEAAAMALCEYFLTNAARGDNAANDDLVAELVDRIRTRRQSPHRGPCRPSPCHPDDLTPAGEDRHD